MPNILQFIPKNSFIHSWLHAYEEDEAPKSFQILAALVALATALKRRVYYDYDLRKRVNTAFNVLLLGPPGLGKTETINHIVQDLLSELPEGRIPYVIGPVTKEKLLDTLTVHPHALMKAPELANCISKDKYKETLAVCLTELLEGKDKYIEEGTISRGNIIIPDLFFTMVGGSTVEYFQDDIPKNAIEGGLLCRFLLVHESEPSQIVTRPRYSYDKRYREEIHRRLDRAKSEFLKCVTNCAGEMQFERWAYDDVLGPWISGRERRTGRMAHFDSRAREMVLRICILLATSCNEMIVTEEHINGAIGIYESCMDSVEPFMERSSDAARNQTKCLEHIKTGGGMLTPVDLYQKMSRICSSMDVDKCIQSLLTSKLIKTIDDGRLMAIGNRRKR